MKRAWEGWEFDAYVVIQTAIGRAGETFFEGQMALYVYSLVSNSCWKAMFIFKNQALTSHNMDFKSRCNKIITQYKE